MRENHIRTAAVQYGKDISEIAVITQGLIHHSYKVSYKDGPTILLQYINENVFRQPEQLIENYLLVQSHLDKKGDIKIPQLLGTVNGRYFFRDEDGNFWRAFEFIKDSYSISKLENSLQAFSVARCFAAFTKSLQELDGTKLHIVIPHFHDLSLRYRQFEEAASTALLERKGMAEEVIAELQARKKLVSFYEELDDKNYPVRIMHHDCKISNVLFDKKTNEIISPVDLDTVMPGKYFSDIGDMIRTMACTLDENSRDWENLSVNEEIYKSIIKGYLEGIGDSFTPEEENYIHYSGLIMTYMQSLRFITDFLNNDIYYQIAYGSQNLDRAKNQFLLLKKLELFLKYEYGLHSYQESVT